YGRTESALPWLIQIPMCPTNTGHSQRVVLTYCPSVTLRCRFAPALEMMALPFACLFIAAARLANAVQLGHLGYCHIPPGVVTRNAHGRIGLHHDHGSTIE